MFYLFTDITATFSSEDVKKHTVASVLAYIPWLFLITLLIAPKSPYAKFHANQGCVLSLLALLTAVVSVATRWILLLLWPVYALCSFIGIAVLALEIYGIVNALHSRAVEFPLISSIVLFR